MVAAVVLYYATPTHSASPLVFGTGLTLAIGGGMPNMLNRIWNPSEYQPPPPPLMPTEPEPSPEGDVP